MTIVKSVCTFFEFWYYQYILVTALYMLEAWERKVFNCFLTIFFAMASYTAYVFLPGHIIMLGHFCEYVIKGLSSTNTTATQVY